MPAVCSGVGGPCAEGRGRHPCQPGKGRQSPAQRHLLTGAPPLPHLKLRYRDLGPLIQCCPVSGAPEGSAGKRELTCTSVASDIPSITACVGNRAGRASTAAQRCTLLAGFDVLSGNAVVSLLCLVNCRRWRRMRRCWRRSRAATTRPLSCSFTSPSSTSRHAPVKTSPMRLRCGAREPCCAKLNASV